jgi:hypothetical protein
VGRTFNILIEEFRYKFGRAGEVAAYYKNRVRVNLKYIDTVEHLYEVIEHEYLHKILDEFLIPIKKEHDLIKCVNWAYYLIP